MPAWFVTSVWSAENLDQNPESESSGGDTSN
jgi:hypothetical protein